MGLDLQNIIRPSSANLYVTKGKDINRMIITGYADNSQLKELNEGGCERIQLEGGL
jgi:hypothetical protein